VNEPEGGLALWRQADTLYLAVQCWCYFVLFYFDPGRKRRYLSVSIHPHVKLQP
jgi:hypothetical protein